ncbi:hypothetical protein MOV65_19490 [Neorhizobium sp. SHOUNA12B]|nr:hypothetical protein [Neorhizobium sp. SHOUNA12B]
MTVGELAHFASAGIGVADFYYRPRASDDPPIDVDWVRQQILSVLVNCIHGYPAHSTALVAADTNGDDSPITPVQSGFWIELLDGDRNYWRGEELFATAVTAVEDWVPHLGAISLNATDEQHIDYPQYTITGGIGKPIEHNKKSPKPPKTYDPDDIRLEFNIGKKMAKDKRAAFIKAVEEFSKGTGPHGCVSLSALDYLQGQIDAFFARGLSLWMIAALFAIFVQSEQEEKNKPVFMVDGLLADENLFKNLNLAGSFSLVIATQDYAKNKLQPDSELMTLMKN